MRMLLTYQHAQQIVNRSHSPPGTPPWQQPPKPRPKARKKYDGPSWRREACYGACRVNATRRQSMEEGLGRHSHIQELDHWPRIPGSQPHAVLHMYMQARGSSPFAFVLWRWPGQETQALASARVPRLATSSRPQQCTAEAKDTDGNAIKDDDADAGREDMDCIQSHSSSSTLRTWWPRTTSQAQA